MRILFTACLTFLPMVAGCFAAAGEGAPRSDAIQLTWETLLTIYGPMAVWLVWFIRIDSIRRKEDKEHRGEWMELLKQSAKTMTKVEEALDLAHADDDKHRTAMYRLVEEVRDIGVMIRGAGGSGNTRIMKNE